MNSFILVVRFAMDGLLTFWLPIFYCYIFLWAGRSNLCFIDFPNIEKCPLIKLRIFLKDIENLAIILVPLIMILSRGHTGQIKG